METKAALTHIIHCRPIMTCGLQQYVGANDVGLNEFGRSRDRAIDVRFCGQMHDGIRLMLTQNTINLVSITDINAFERIPLALTDFSQRLKVAGVGQLIDVNDRVGGTGDDMANDCRADKPGTAGN
jgi:hypothetical protein